MKRARRDEWQWFPDPMGRQCPTCGAAPGKKCRSRASGCLVDEHVGRSRIRIGSEATAPVVTRVLWRATDEPEPVPPTVRVQLPDPEERPTIPLWPDAAKALGLGRDSAYSAANRGEIPGVMRIGGKWIVATAKLCKALGIRPERQTA